MTLPMDIRLASDNARFGFVFARRGIVPEACSSYFLPRVVGISQAAEWCYTGRVFPAAGGARRPAWCAASTRPTSCSPRRARWRAEIAENASPVRSRSPAQMLWRMLGADHPMEAHRVDSRGILERGRSADSREGVMSFLEKRPAEFPHSRSAPTCRTSSRTGWTRSSRRSSDHFSP